MNKKDFILLTAVYILIGFLICVGFVSVKPVSSNAAELVRTPFQTIFKEPVVIEKEVIVEVEKEVIVYVEKEPEVAAISTGYTAQGINGYFDITQPSNLTSEQIYNMLSGNRSGLQSVATAIYDAEQTYGVNALYLTAKLGYESGWGKYETGTNNIAGWKGNKGSWSNFDSRYDCVMTVANGLANDFVKTQGSSLYSIVQRYCTDNDYLENILSIMKELEGRI